jgi:hypothetical protein
MAMAFRNPQTPIARTVSDLNGENIRALYDSFDSPIMALDCGKKCAPHNPSGKPFCCDICHAVPAAYASEWSYLQANTDLWHAWRGDECADVADPAKERAHLQADTPENMILLACLGPDRCQRPFRALSCRQFPFFPYVTADYRFIGLAYEWTFEQSCWVISNLKLVSQKYRAEFIHTFDDLFARFQDEFDNYAYHSEKMRRQFIAQKRRIPILHRNGNYYLLSPAHEHLQKVDESRLPRFGPYRIKG